MPVAANRIVPRRAGVKPSECCSKSAQKRMTFPAASVTIWWTVNEPVRVFDPRESIVMLRPGWPGSLNG